MLGLGWCFAGPWLFWFNWHTYTELRCAVTGWGDSSMLQFLRVFLITSKSGDLSVLPRGMCVAAAFFVTACVPGPICC